MIAEFKKIFGFGQRNNVDKDDDFADFFYNASALEKENLMKDVMQRATQDQLATIKKAKEM